MFIFSQPLIELCNAIAFSIFTENVLTEFAYFFISKKIHEITFMANNIAV